MAGVDSQARRSASHASMVGVVDNQTEATHDVGITGCLGDQRAKCCLINWRTGVGEVLGVNVLLAQHAKQCGARTAVVRNVQCARYPAHAVRCGCGGAQLLGGEGQVQFGTVDTREVADVDSCCVDAAPDMG
ncbi:hypothetical protein AB0G86_24550 [Streptomyces scabiei]|uniref:hypothetical protein n=1 Tax=Streptomyces scabiei TaxID=1930 RepID=UPI0033CFC216